MPVEKEARIRTYVPEVDKALSGGIPKGHITLISGGAGTFKSSFCFNILYNASLDGHKCVYVTLEQTGSSMLDQIRSMGYQLHKIKLQQVLDTTGMFAGMAKLDSKNTDFVLLDIANVRRELLSLTKKSSARHDWFDIIKTSLAKLKEKGLAEVFVLDSITALYALSNFKEPRKDIFNLFSSLKQFGCTSFLVSELVPATVYGEYGMENYLSDGIIQLSTSRKEMKVVGELSVIKMRATEINRDVFVIEYKDHGFKVNPYWMGPQMA